jgi:hypothetical protein
MSLASRLIKAIFATEAGVLTAVSSPAADDNSKKIATTEWAAFGFAVLKAANGYIKFPTWLGGVIIQWGTFNGTMAKSSAQTLETYSGGASVTFPIPFPNVVGNVSVITPDNAVFTCEYANLSAKSVTGFSSVIGGIPNATGGPANYTFNGYTWLAIGW